MAYEEYPRHLHKAGGVYTIVTTDEDKAAALADGWALQPVIDAPADAEPEEPKGEPKGKPGRKPKTVSE